MKLKYFLRGFGVGIIVAALVLCISYRSENSDSSVIERARKLGMEFPEKTPDALVSPSATPSVTSTPGITKKPTAEPTDKATKKPAGRQLRTFTVRSGLLSSSVSREMKEAGIIEDSDAFDKYLEKSGMAKKVMAGKYKIPVGASYEEIAQIITKSD